MLEVMRQRLSAEVCDKIQVVIYDVRPTQPFAGKITKGDMPLT